MKITDLDVSRLRQAAEIAECAVPEGDGELGRCLRLRSHAESNSVCLTVRTDGLGDRAPNGSAGLIVVRFPRATAIEDGTALIRVDRLVDRLGFGGVGRGEIDVEPVERPTNQFVRFRPSGPTWFDLAQGNKGYKPSLFDRALDADGAEPVDVYGDPKAFVDALRQTAAVAPSPKADLPTRHNRLCGVHFDDNRLIATDGNRLRSRGLSPRHGYSCTLPSHALKPFARAFRGAWTSGEDGVQIQRLSVDGDELIHICVGRFELYVEPYEPASGWPNVEDVVPSYDPMWLARDVDPRQLGERLRLASQLSGEPSGRSCLRLDPNENRGEGAVVGRAKNADGERFESVLFDAPIEQNCEEINVVPEQLAAAAEAFEQQHARIDVKAHGPFEPIRLSPAGVGGSAETYDLIMPRRRPDS